MTRRRKIKILIGILALPFLVCAFLVFEHVRGRINLSRYKRELIAKGEKLTMADLKGQSPKGENGAPEIFTAAKQIKEGSVLMKSFASRMRMTPSGRAIVGSRESDWVDSKVEKPWEQVAADLKVNKALLEQIRVALEKPVLDNNLDLSKWSSIDISHVGTAKLLSLWFCASSQLSLHEKQNQDALRSLIAEIRLVRVLAEDRLVSSELMRIAQAAIARSDTWEALQAEEWTDDELAQMQRAWEVHNFASSMIRSLEGEIIYDLATFQLIRDSNLQAFQFIFALKEYLGPEDSGSPFVEKSMAKLPGGEEFIRFAREDVYCRVWRFAWLDQDERHHLESINYLLALNRESARRKTLTTILPTLATPGNGTTTGQGWYDSLRFPIEDPLSWLSGVGAKSMKAETERSMVICAIALKRYSLKHGGLPSTLQSLVPEFVASVPVDHMDGKPLRYKVNADGSFVLYSIGGDAKDDGGDGASLLDKSGSHFTWWNRKDLVWPAPALAEEVEAYRKGSAVK